MLNPLPAPGWPVLREIAHPRCVACSPDNKSGLRLDFHATGDGAVCATFDCNSAFEGYPGQLHRGIISTMLDAAMTHCLFAQRLQGVTAELSVRFKAPVLLKHPATAGARIVRDLFPLFLMEATLTQDGETKAMATGKFVVPQGL